MKHLDLEVQSYRAFRDKAKIEIRPLTLIYGPNQAGKSSILRLLGVLADSLHANNGPLDTSSPALRNATFKELGWLGRDMSLTPRFTLTGSGDGHDISLHVKFARDDNGDFIVDTFEVKKGGNSKFNVSFTNLVKRQGDFVTADYEGIHIGEQWSGELNFQQLIPYGLPEQIESILNEENLQWYISRLEHLQWLQANRLVDSPNQSGQKSRCCQPDGSDLARELRGEVEQQVLSKTSDWLRKQGLANDLRINRADTRPPEFEVRHSGREALRLALAGEGLRSLLPILLCTIWAELGVDYAPTMLAIEEPESHLHPTLQVELFNRLIESVQSGVPIVLETHSVYILRAMQVAVLEGKLNAEDIGLHWVSQNSESGAATIEEITIKNDAVLTNWLPQTFEKEQELAHQIIDLRWKQGHST